MTKKQSRKLGSWPSVDAHEAVLKDIMNTLADVADDLSDLRTRIARYLEWGDWKPRGFEKFDDARAEAAAAESRRKATKKR